MQAEQGLRSNHMVTIESFWHNHTTYLIIVKYSSVPTEGMKILGIPTVLFIIVIWVLEFSNGEYKIRSQKVPKFDFQSKFSMSKIIRIFLNYFSLNNTNLGTQVLWLIVFLITSISNCFISKMMPIFWQLNTTIFITGMKTF